jgi:PAS domain S-box-containing protein
MDYLDKTKEELIIELRELQQNFNSLRTSNESEIVHRIQVEEALQESDQNYKLISELTADYVYKLGVAENGKVTLDFVSDNFYSLTGRKREDALTVDSWGSIIHPEDLPKVMRHLQLLSSGPQSVEIECRSYIHGHTLRWINIISKSEQDVHLKRVTSIIGAVKDITIRKNAELQLKEKTEEVESQNKAYLKINEELFQSNQDLINAKQNTEESERKYKLLYNNTPVMMQSANMQGKLVSVNDFWLQIMGYKLGEVIGKNSKNYLTKQSQLLYNEKIAELLKTGKLNNVEAQAIKKNGKIIDLSISSNILYNIHGEPVQTMTYMIDITEKKQTELILKSTNEELRQLNYKYLIAKEKAEDSEKQFRYLFENMEQGFAVHEMIFDSDNKPIDYRFLHINKAFEKLTGVSASDYLGKTVKEVLPNIEKIWIENYGQVAQTGIPMHFESFAKELNRHYEVVAYSPKKGFFAVVFTDVTKNKIYEKEILAAKEKAEESDRLKTSFLQNMSHEIRTPMNAIMGFSALLPDQFNDKSKLEQYTKIISQRSSDLLDIINDILDISKIESGQLAVNIEECDLNELFAEITTFFTEYKKRIEKQHIKLKLQALCDPSEHIIATDLVKLKQIFINLISNAFKYTNEGKIEGGCKLDEKNNLVFYVSDTGSGIPRDKHEAVFERFFQLHQGPIRNIGGTGLGLSIVKGLVGLLGGEIFLESEPGIGSTFTFTIPFKTIQPLHHGPSVVKTPNEKNFSDKTILIVEDDLYNAEYLKEILLTTRLNVLYAETGNAAIDASINQHVDLVLMDIRLPDMNGYEAAQKIRQYKPEMKIIAQTAYASQSDKQKAFDAGFNDYVSKPTKKELLLSMVNRHLEEK